MERTKFDLDLIGYVGSKGGRLPGGDGINARGEAWVGASADWAAGESAGQMRLDSLDRVSRDHAIVTCTESTYTEAKDYYPHSEHMGVCSEQQYEPFV